jgi:hypothetical protein
MFLLLPLLVLEIGKRPPPPIILAEFSYWLDVSWAARLSMDLISS